MPDAVRIQADQRRVAHRVGRPEHQLVARPQCVRDGGGDVQACRQRVDSQLAADGLVGVPVGLRAALQPGRVGRSGNDRPGAGGLRVARDVRPARPGGQRVDRHLRVGQ
jgi:hypothetical protein